MKKGIVFSERTLPPDLRKEAPVVRETLLFRRPESSEFNPLNSIDYGRGNGEVFRPHQARRLRGRQACADLSGDVTP
jgi:hypothetical protein